MNKFKLWWKRFWCRLTGGCVYWWMRLLSYQPTVAL